MKYKNTFFNGINKFNKKSSIYVLILVFMAMVFTFSFLNPNFIAVSNIKTILLYLSVQGIMALGTSLLIISGNLDLSVGSIVGVTSIVVAKLYNIEGLHMPLILVILIGLSIGILIGMFNGFLVSVIGINSLIATLGSMFLFRGLSYVYTTETLNITYNPFLTIGRAYLFDTIPFSFIYFFIIFVIVFIILKFTRFGKNIYAIGANSYISKLFGVKVEKSKFILFIISGFTASLSGIILTSQLALGTARFGQGYELTIFAMIFLGGVSLSGGKGSVLGVFIAILIIGSITNGLTLIGVPIIWREFFEGMILIIAVAIDSVKKIRTY